jgi:hypothetical protein
MAGFNHFGDIAAVIPQATSQVVRKTAFDIQAGYQGTAARDTGFMANSSYVVTSQDSNYGGAGSPPKGATLLPEVAGPPDDQTAYVAVGASYAIDVELGTRFQPAQPAFFPAVEAVRPGFESAVAAIEQQMKAAAGQ